MKIILCCSLEHNTAMATRLSLGYVINQYFFPSQIINTVYFPDAFKVILSYYSAAVISVAKISRGSSLSLL